MSAQQDYLLIAERQRYNAEKGTSAWGTTSIDNYPPEVVLSKLLVHHTKNQFIDLYQEGGVNWFDMIMQNTVSPRINEISLSGGDEKTSFADFSWIYG